MRDIPNNVHIEFMEATTIYEQEGILETLVEIHISVNDMFTPSLSIRHKADTVEVLREKLYQRFIERIAEGYNFYLLYIDGHLVGFNNHRVAEMDIMGSTYSTLEIGTTCIHSDHQNMGYGKYMYSFLEMDSKLRYHIEAVVRTTWSTNLRQQHLYHLFGYEEFIIYKHNYGIRGLHMMKFCKILNDVQGVGY